MKSTQNSLISVLIVGDSPVAREGLGVMISQQSDLELIGKVECVEAALALAKTRKPGVIMVDLISTKTSIFDAAKALVTSLAGVKVILLSEFGLPRDFHRARETGVHGFLAKTIDGPWLAKSIKQAFNQGFCSPFDTSGALSSTVVVPKALSDRELEVLELMRRGMSNNDIGTALHISAQTVLTHAKSLFSKLHVANRAEAVAVGFDRGYLHLHGTGRSDGTWGE